MRRVEAMCQWPSPRGYGQGRATTYPLLLLFALPITVYNSLPLIRERGREPVRRSQNEKGGGHVPVAITKGLWPREGHYLSFALALSIAYYFLLLTTTNQKEGEGANEEATQ